MAIPLVETKLYAPRPRRTLVARPRLSDRIGRGVDESRLTLISAPAGFGKTTLLAEWLGAASAGSVGWLSLEPSDNQPSTFWTYLITALQRAASGVGASSLPLLQSGRSSVDTVLATLLNELGVVPHDVALVLDDFHVVDSAEVHEGVAFLLEHLPPQVRVVISTRADPALPLARMRARGELLELRASDLRFTPEEARTYLTEVVGLDLTAADVSALEGRTEGWIAALQLAALSMQGREDLSGFIAGFAGDDRYIVDYLVEEVLGRQPEPVHRFLVETSVLDRLTGPLCDALTGQHGGKAMLETLDRGNLFVFALDDSRRWYRYHHLFGDVLRTHLADERPGDVRILNRRASDWYDENGEPVAAVRHALAAGDVDRAADLVELAIPELQRARQEAVIRGWLDAIPDDVVAVRPVLAIGFIGALMGGNEFEGVEGRLRDVERVLERAADAADVESAGLVVVNEDQLPRLPAAIEMYRAALALAGGDGAGVAHHAHLAIERSAEDDHVIRAATSALQGLAQWGDGDLEAAHRAYSVCVEGLERAGHLSDVLGCCIALADIRCTQGRLGEALATFEKALGLCSQGDGAMLRGTADMYVGMSQIACERGDVTTATAHLQRALELGEHTWLPQNPYRWRLAMARIRESEGDLVGALDLIDEAQSVYVGDFSPNVRPIPALRARVLATHGRVGDALDWVREQGLSADDDVSYLLEFEHVTLARVLLARSEVEPWSPYAHDADRLLERLRLAAEAGDRTGSLIEILVLQALGHRSSGDVTGASAALERALTLAEPEGYQRVFVAEGPPMAALLRDVEKQRAAWDYVRRLLDACGDPDPSGPAAVTAPGSPGLVDPLSDREQEVLRLLGSELSGPEIARELTVSLNTLRTHTKSIYTKLGVNSRRAAVHRATELDLASRRHDR